MDNLPHHSYLIARTFAEPWVAKVLWDGKRRHSYFDLDDVWGVWHCTMTQSVPQDMCHVRSCFPMVFLEHVWVGIYTGGGVLPPAIAVAGVHLCTEAISLFLTESLTPRRCTFWKEMIWWRVWKALLVVRPCFSSNLAMGSCMRNTAGWMHYASLCGMSWDWTTLRRYLPGLWEST